MRHYEKKIYLASKSPRRRDLLRQIGVDFELLLVSPSHVANPDTINENFLPDETPRDYVRRIAREKVNFAWDLMDRRKLLYRPILAADTIVVLNGQVLGKPTNAHEAMEMMQTLSGKTHKVLTSVVIKLRDNIYETLQESEVSFANLSEETIKAYCNTLEPYDKAGGYGIQGLAATFITHISGSYSGIMGLPLYETTQLMNEAKINY